MKWLSHVVCCSLPQVSTYALFLEDVLEVASDYVVVHEAAASRIQRVTKVHQLAQPNHLSLSFPRAQVS